MKPAKAASTAQIRALNEQSKFGFALSDEGLSNLDPARPHVGVPLMESEDGRTVVVSWALRLRGGDGLAIAHIDSPHDEVAALPSGEVPDELAARLAYELRRWLLDVVESQLGTEAAFRWLGGET
jgi:hypothetical protein